MATNLTQTQAQQIISLFNGAPTQQKYSITIQDSGGNKATSNFTFSLQKPNILSEIGESFLQPWNWISTAGQVWTGITTGNADVMLNTTTGIDINSGVQQLILDNKNPIGTESLSIATPANIFNFLYHQIDNAVNVTAQILYCSSSGALVALTVTPNSGVITSAGYSIVSQSGLLMTNASSMIQGNSSVALLQVGSLDSSIEEAANTITISGNSTSGQLTQQQQPSTSANYPTVSVTPTTPTNSSTNASSTISTTSSTNVSTTPSTNVSSTVSSAPFQAQPQYAASSTASSSNSSNSSSGKSNLTTYLIIGGVAAAGVIALMFFMKKKK